MINTAGISTLDSNTPSIRFMSSRCQKTSTISCWNSVSEHERAFDVTSSYLHGKVNFLLSSFSIRRTVVDMRIERNAVIRYKSGLWKQAAPEVGKNLMRRKYRT